MKEIMSDSSELKIDITTPDGVGLDRGFTWLVKGFALCTVFLLFWMIWVILSAALPAVQTFGLGFFLSQNWDVGALVFGALPYVYGTLMTSVIALVIGVPIAIAVALVTSETFLPRWVRSPLAA